MRIKAHEALERPYTHLVEFSGSTIDDIRARIQGTYDESKQIERDDIAMWINDNGGRAFFHGGVGLILFENEVDYTKFLLTFK